MEVSYVSMVCKTIELVMVINRFTRYHVGVQIALCAINCGLINTDIRGWNSKSLGDLAQLVQ